MQALLALTTSPKCDGDVLHTWDALLGFRGAVYALCKCDQHTASSQDYGAWRLL